MRFGVYISIVHHAWKKQRIGLQFHFYLLNLKRIYFHLPCSLKYHGCCKFLGSISDQFEMQSEQPSKSAVQKMKKGI